MHYILNIIELPEKTQHAKKVSFSGLISDNTNYFATPKTNSSLYIAYTRICNNFGQYFYTNATVVKSS